MLPIGSNKRIGRAKHVRLTSGVLADFRQLAHELGSLKPHAIKPGLACQELWPVGPIQTHALHLALPAALPDLLPNASTNVNKGKMTRTAPRCCWRQFQHPQTRRTSSERPEQNGVRPRRLICTGLGVCQEAIPPHEAEVRHTCDGSHRSLRSIGPLQD